MPINALSVAQGFKTPSVPEMRAKRTSRRRNALSLAGEERKYSDQNSLRNLAMEGGSPEELAARYRKETGDMQGVAELQKASSANALSKTNQDKANLERAIQGIEYVASKAPTVTKENYPAFVAEAEGLGIIESGAMPRDYDKAVVDRLSATAQEA